MAEAIHHTYAVVDPARAPQLYPMLQAMHPMDAPCLFDDVPEQVHEVAPHIFPAVRGGAILDAWQRNGRDDAWGIFLTSTAGLHDVRRHLGRFLQVRLPDGEGPVLFRLWDPRVLHPFLLASGADHLSALFSGASSYVAEHDGRLERLTFAQGSITRRPTPWQELAR